MPTARREVDVTKPEFYGFYELFVHDEPDGDPTALVSKADRGEERLRLKEHESLIPLPAPTNLE